MRTTALTALIVGTLVACSVTPTVQDATSGPRQRVLWERATEIWGTPTADGRLLSFPDWETGDLAVRDLIAGQSRHITDRGGRVKAEGKVESSAMSPDGKFIAFAWEHVPSGRPDEFALHLIASDGTGERILLPTKGTSYVEAHDWSPDGKWIAAMVQYHSAPGGKILGLSPDGSAPRVVLTLTDRVPMMVRFSPDGKWLAFHAGSPGRPLNPPLLPPRVASTTRQQSVYVVAADGSTASPIEVASDANLMAWTPGGDGLLFRRERNGVMELHLQPFSNGRAAGSARRLHGITDIGPALGMTRSGTLIYGRSRQIREAVLTSVDPSTGAIGPLEATRPLASFGPGGMGGGVRFSPDGKYSLYTPTPTAILLRTADGAERTLMPQMTRVGRIEWAADSGSLLIAGEAAGRDGVYRVDLQSGAATLVFAAPAVGLLAPSADGKTLYYRSGSGAVMARDLTTQAERSLTTPEATALDLKVSRDGTRLAIVGQNVLTFVDLKTGAARVRYEQPPRADKFWGGEWSADGRHFFTCVASLGPYATGKKELWTLPVAGGEPRRQPVPWAVRGLSLSHDGTQLALGRFEQQMQVWALENFLPSPGATR